MQSSRRELAEERPWLFPVAVPSWQYEHLCEKYQGGTIKTFYSLRPSSLAKVFALDLRLRPDIVIYWANLTNLNKIKTFYIGLFTK